MKRCYERYIDPYKDYDWDNDGFPGEYVYDNDCHVNDYYMDEIWKPVRGFGNDYWISDKGRLYSTISKKFMCGTPVGECGHLDVSLHKNGMRYHRYLHRLVAEAFIPNPRNLPLVRHLDNDPSNNDIDNLAWGTMYDNMQDCIMANRFSYFNEDDREKAMRMRRTPIVAINLKTGEELEFISQQEASRVLGLNQASINRVLRGLGNHAGGYYFFYTNTPKKIDILSHKYSRHRAPIKAINVRTGIERIFIGQTEAAEALGLSVSSVSMVLSGKMRQAKDYIFTYIEEDELND